ncbi:undecaprenyl-diphosphate phosphatase [Dermatobacter hominis]|uniref:undecaprenyl-diphosphate phosphatase n=1 Tax=Dermatobacter hominis TaxID=2884263 RepID=UPI001D104480|nr:undecaprenyl-diphosphate phosphatase [Dermatobacter hominis]UDY34194.1 undecaprenyl-diphosphate phosphatase [Dermatobacter hominis]
MPERLVTSWRLASPRLRCAIAAALAMAAVVLVARPADAAALAGAAADVGEELLSWWQAAILGIVEGITEYLPISSTGHLLVVSRLLGLPSEEGSAGLEAVNTYAVAIQFGAILAVVGLFWKRFVSMVKGLFGRDDGGRHLLVVLVLAFLPSAILGFLFDDAIEGALFGPWPIVAAWVVGGIVILVLERSGLIPDRGEKAAPGTDPLLDITYRQALIIGAAQCLALWPGTSRSLTTILAALLIGVAVPAAVEFSFLLGFATLTSASLYKMAKDGDVLIEQFGVVTPLIGVLAAFVSAVIAIKWLVSYLERHDLTIFAWYRFVVAAIAAGLLLAGTI